MHVAARDAFNGDRRCEIRLETGAENAVALYRTALRLIILPFLLGFILKLTPLRTGVYMLVMICYVSMPLGLNTVVIPTAYGKDTSLAAGMALVSNVLSVLTIPLVFMVFL